MNKDLSMQGIYSVQEAARLLRVDSRKVSNWANGYTYKRKQDIGAQLPVLQSDRTLPKVINFRELFELMAVRDLRKLDVKLETIRSVSRLLSEKLDTPYPFASEKIFRDGKKLLVQYGSDYIQPDTGQIVMDRFFDMVDELNFEDGSVEAWRPKHGENDVIVDPNLLFGDPAVVGRRISTRTILNLFIAEGNHSVVAEEYDLSVDQIKHVIRFEFVASRSRVMADQPTFFFDENISPQLASSLRNSGAPGNILHCRTQKMDGMSDSEWIPVVADKGLDYYLNRPKCKNSQVDICRAC